jgi:hypothetical protein
MDIHFCKTRMRSLAATACVLLGSVWTGAASAQTQPTPVWNEKVAQLTEPHDVRSELRLGAAVGAGGNFILSQGGSAVYAFAKNAQGEWTQTAKLLAPSGGVLTGPIAFDGTHALIRGYDTQKTSVVVHYFYDGTRWRTLGVLKGAAPFGTTIALDGCTALIASSYEVGTRIVNPVRPRFVHHFDRCRSGTGSWTWVGSISAASYGGGVNFGASIALNGNNAIIGDAQRVYHFVRSGDTWTLRQTIEETEPEFLTNFGYSLAFRDNLLLIAAHGKLTEFDDQEGVVIRYTWNGTQWVRQGPVPFPRGPDTANYEDLGRKIVITNDRVFFAAPARIGRVTTIPLIYAMERLGLDDIRQRWLPLRDIDYSVPFDETFGYTQYGDTDFGADLAVSGNTLVVGAPAFSPPEKPALVEGRTTVYTIPPPAP